MTATSMLPKAVIFDLDDVLYPRRQYLLSGCRVVADFMFSIYGKEIYDDLAEVCITDAADCSGAEDDFVITERVFETVLTKHFDYVEDGLLFKLAHIFHSHVPKIALHSDASVALAILRQMSIRTGLISNELPGVQKLKIKALKLDHLLDSMLCTSDLLGKDNLRDALWMMELDMEIPLTSMAYVGNSVTSDMQTPKEMGMYTVMVKRNESSHAMENKGSTHSDPPNITLQSLDNLFTTLKAPENDENTESFNFSL